MPPGGGRVAVLLSTYNGDRFLREQLDSLVAQSNAHWVLFWRDDGSVDGTTGLLREFAAGAGRGRCVEIGPPGRLGPTPSFLAVLRAALEGGFDAFAFADQDDVWLPEKLARGMAALAAGPPDRPVLYCARQVFVDEKLGRIGLSERLRRQPAFPAALAQNVVTGCTLQLNRVAAKLVAESRPPSVAVHDWWAYLVVAAAGGTVLVDDTPSVLYRQHGTNLIGAPKSMPRRAVGALRRGSGVFMNVFRQQVAALAEQPNLLSDSARLEVQAVSAALRGGVLDRLRLLRRLGGLCRQTWPETLVFRAWFLLG